MSERDKGGLILCVDGAEARMLRKAGHKCVTSVKLRRQLRDLLLGGAEDAPALAAEAVGRFSGVSSAASPERWGMWRREEFAARDLAPLMAAFRALPSIPTPFRDPEDIQVCGPLQPWPCSGTTVLVAKDTFALVRVADTYAASNPYRPHGRMDEPFTPRPGRVCLVTADELRLVCLDPSQDNEVVLAYRVETEGQNVTGHGVTPLPSPIRALCGENPGLRVGVAPMLVAPRSGNPFFLGLTRGTGYETEAKADHRGAAALDFCLETDTLPEELSYRVVVWAGGDDVRQLARYGGLSIFLGRGRRRKVQLRSLGLRRSGAVAGAPVYDLDANRAVLRAWSVSRRFERKHASMRDRDSRRVRSSKASPESTRGTYNINTMSPGGIRVTVKSGGRQAASMLRRYLIGEAEGGSVMAVRLDSLSEGKSYHLNGRARESGGDVLIDPKRSKIRGCVWHASEPSKMLERLAGDPHVVFSGMQPGGEVFAAVRVANGTEDQQREAVARWGQSLGGEFLHLTGCNSWAYRSIEPGYAVRVGALHHVNWRAAALETAGFERYKESGDYGQPLKIARRGTASASERARAYADKVEGLGAEGGRNTALAGAMLNIADKFGAEALEEVAPALMARSTLPVKEKTKMARRIAARARGKEGGSYHGTR